MFPFQRKIAIDSVETKAGDLIGFSGRNWLSAGINVATYGIPFWGLSHVGLLANAPDGRLLLWESTSLDGDTPCAITGKPIAGTQAHELAQTVRRYRGRVWHYALYRRLYPQEYTRLTEFLAATIGVPYDEIGAFRSAGVGLSFIESLFHEQNLTTIFCSEMVAAAYATIGVFVTDNVSRWNPNRLVRRLRQAEILFRPQRLK